MKTECDLDDSVVRHNNEVAIFIVLIGILMTLCYFMVLDYLEKTSKIDFKAWDLNTCTAADYSVELRIPLEVYK